MWVALLGWWIGAAQADDLAFAEDATSLPTQIKRGLTYGVRSSQGRVHITRVRLFPAVIEMTEEDLAERLASDEPLPIGILETREHGRLRVSCHIDTCTGASGGLTVELKLISEPDPADDPGEAPADPPPRRKGARRQT